MEPSEVENWYTTKVTVFFETGNPSRVIREKFIELVIDIILLISDIFFNFV